MYFIRKMNVRTETKGMILHGSVSIGNGWNLFFGTDQRVE
jgi:hypothetical protein